MANLILGFPNRIDEATLSGGSWEASLPLTNLQDRRLAKVARSTDLNTTSTQFAIDLTKDRKIKIVVLVNHNLTIDAAYRVTIASDAGFTSIIYQTSWNDVWGSVYDSLNLEWEDENFWLGNLTEEERASFTSNLIVVLPSVYVGRYIKVEVDDQTNTSNYIQIGRCFVSEQWQVTNNILYGASLGYETNTQVESSLDDTEYFDVRNNYRVFRFELESYNYDEGHQKLLDVSRSVGVDKEVFVVPDPDDTANMIRRAFLGRLKTLNPITYPYYNTNRAGFEIKEIT